MLQRPWKTISDTLTVAKAPLEDVLHCQRPDLHYAISDCRTIVQYTQ